tara:strand:- start:7 stop:753 length:747 start_codon:yes stop_codon:yes gene_type:complete
MLKIVSDMKLIQHIIYLGIIVLSSCSTIYELDSNQNDIIAVSGKPDSLITLIIEPYKIGIDSIMNEKLCVSDMEMVKGKPESLLGNFITDLCLEEYYQEADICIMNNGGLRSSLPKGEVTRGKIYELMPFDNELVILNLNEKDFNGLLKYIISRGGEPFSGMSITTNKQGELLSYKINNSINFNNGDIIRVITSDYLANGGDKMWFFKDKKQKKVDIKLRDVIINYCKKNKKITSQIDGRLEIKLHEQ